MSEAFAPSEEMLEVLGAVKREQAESGSRFKIGRNPFDAVPEIVKGNETFLGSAEKKLVSAYRDELSVYLFYLGRLRVYSQERAAIFLPDTKDMMKMAQDHVNHCHDSGAYRRGIEHLRKNSALARDEFRNIEWESPQSLFLRMSTLSGRDSARIMLGLAYFIEGKHYAAEKIWAKLLFSSHSDLYGDYAARNLGMLYFHQRKFEKAAAAYQHALLLNSESVSNAAYGIISSAHSKDRAGIKFFQSRMLDLGGTSDKQEVRDIVDICHKQNEAFGGRYRVDDGIGDGEEVAEFLLSPYRARKTL